MIRLLAIDIDGTLLDSRGRLPDAHREAVVDAHASGIEIALVTGRSFHFALPTAASAADSADAGLQQRRAGEIERRRHRTAQAAAA